MKRRQQRACSECEANRSRGQYYRSTMGSWRCLSCGIVVPEPNPHVPVLAIRCTICDQNLRVDKETREVYCPDHHQDGLPDILKGE